MKKRLGAGLLLVLCVTLLTACASTSTTGTSQTNMGQMNMGQTNMSQMSMTPTSMSQTGTTPTSTSQAKAVKVQITLSDFHITSSIMTFTAGVPYHFAVTNTGKAAHELVLMSTTMKTMNMSGMPMNNMDEMALASLMAINPGATKTFDYTFALSTAGPHPEFACHLPGHYEMGMHLDITVKQ
jgi:uncharacterized cupredoxin-like copper-binding protein